MITPPFNLTATERVLPKLALDFTTALLDSRVTFTRTTGASNPATYVNSSGYITEAINNQPRFDYDPTLLICKGLLIEESRSNILTYSSQFNDASWTKSNTSVSADVVASPSNSVDADKIVEDSTNNSHSVSKAISITTGTAYSISVYAKSAGRNWLRVTTSTSNFGASFVWFDLANGVVGTQTSATGTITNVGNGWYRCTVVKTSVGTGTGTIFFAPQSADNQTSYQGDGTSGVYLWGAQLEAGDFATSYIPTTTTALTRNADVATMTGTNFSDWFNANAGSAVIQALPIKINGTRPAIQFDDTTSNELIALRGVAADPQLYVVDGGAAQATLDAGTLTANSAYRLGAAWQSANFAVALNGGTTVSQLSGTYPTVTQLRLGSDGTNYFNGWLQNLRYWVQRVTNSETQAFSK